MRPPRTLPIVLVLAAACSSAGGSPTGGGDYFGQLERISQNAHIQERGLARELDRRVERAETPADRLAAIEVTVDQRTRLYQDVVDALTGLEPLEGLEAAHDAYLRAWEEILEVIRKVRDPGFRTVTEYLSALEAPRFAEAGSTVRTACQDLQTIASAADRPVDLACEGRPS